MTTVVATAAVLGAGVAYHSKYSATERIKRVNRDVDYAHQLHEEILTIPAPKLRTVVGGQAVLDHSNEKRLDIWRVKIQARRVREGVQQAGWLRRHIFPWYKTKKREDDLALMEERIRRFVTDAVDTSALADKLTKEGIPLPILETDDDPFVPTVGALVTITEEPEETDLRLND